VLLAEDSLDLRETLAELLGAAGHTVHAFADGLAAAECARAIGPEVVLLDLGLPGIDGLEVARRVRAALGERPLIVAVTGDARDEDRRRAREAGFDALLAKPVDLEELERIVDAGKTR
jgi:CheY-like chemotaxis protein